MELHNLKPAEGAIKKSKRVGRGQGSGKGGTSTRGHKGAKSRSGYKTKIGFEGGQMPLQRRIPKRGFNNFNRVSYTAINLSKVQSLVDKYKFSDFTVDALRQANLISKTERIKILANGELKSKLNFSVHALSAKAREAIESLGGEVTIV